MKRTLKRSYSKFELFTVGCVTFSGFCNGVMAGWHINSSSAILHVLTTLLCGVVASIISILVTLCIIPLMVNLGQIVLQANCYEDRG